MLQAIWAGNKMAASSWYGLHIHHQQAFIQIDHPISCSKNRSERVDTFTQKKIKPQSGSVYDVKRKHYRAVSRCILFERTKRGGKIFLTAFFRKTDGLLKKPGLRFCCCSPTEGKASCCHMGLNITLFPCELEKSIDLNV